MTHWPAFQFDPENFSGMVRLFPLPNLVLFPHVVQPLHIFEPRYRELLEDALADDQLMASAVLEPGWENQYEGRPAIAPIACLGHVLTHTKLEDGRYNLLLVGVQRISILRELPPTRPFRRAEVRLLEDHYPDSGEAGRGELQRRLLSVFRRFVPDTAGARAQFEQLLSQRLSLGMLTDIMGFTLNFQTEFKQRLLQELNVDLRARWMIDLLSSDSGPKPPEPDAAPPLHRPWPPDFSVN